MKKGVFIVFDGIDGSGKSEQIVRLHDYIKKQDKYQSVLTTREPTHRAKELKRKLASDKDAFSGGEEMAKLYVGDRRIHTHEQIIPELKQGTIVLCDRYLMSTLAYQLAQGVPLDYLLKLHEEAGIIAPDLILLINLPVGVALERIAKAGRKEGREKFEKSKEFMESVAEKYMLLTALAETDSRIKALSPNIAVVDGRGTVEEVAQRISLIFDRFYQSFMEKA